MRADMDAAPLRRLRYQYFALVPSRILRLPPPLALAKPANQAYMFSHMLENSRFPQPEGGYRRLFWRGVLREMEVGLRELQVGAIEAEEDDSELEIDERFYELMAGLMVARAEDTGTDPSRSHRTFIYDLPLVTAARSSVKQRDERYITLLEEQTVLQGGTTGLRTWTAALHLGHYLLHNTHLLLSPDSTPSDGHPATILELGAGTGFLSCLLAQQGYEVISTDLGDVLGGGISPLVRLRHNVDLNELAGRIKVQELDWMDAQRAAEERPKIWHDLERTPPGTIIAADVIYDPDLVPPLVAALRTLLLPSSNTPAHQPRRAIIAATARNPATLTLFIDTCAHATLDVADVELPPVDEESPTFWDSGLDVSVPVRVLRVTPRMQLL